MKMMYNQPDPDRLVHNYNPPEIINLAVDNPDKIYVIPSRESDPDTPGPPFMAFQWQPLSPDCDVTMPDDLAGTWPFWAGEYANGVYRPWRDEEFAQACKEMAKFTRP